MRKKILLFILSFSCSQHVFAQLQTNFWYFGILAGVDFSSGSPVALTNGTINTNEGTASMSDNTGNLLFYTDGVQVWDKNNVQMPNGFGLFGDYSTTQTIIVPNPGNTDLYYIFTLDDEGDPAGLNYSVVDMALQGGNGDVTVKNNFLRTNMTEKLAAVYHCNNHDIWVMAHDRFTNAFVAYLVTNSGVSASPVISNTGMAHTDVHGQLKFTSDGNRLACAAGYQDTIEVFDFDKSTGIVSNPLSIPVFHHVYGIEFSPDNTKLYGTYYDLGSTSVLVQYDLNAANIPASQVPLASSPDPIIYALQLARDNKIYVTKEITPFLGVINSPNVAGTGCNFVDNAVNLDPLGFGVMCMLGLPGFIQSYFNPDFPNVPCSVVNANFFSSDTVLCQGQCINFTDTSAGVITSWVWTFSGAVPSSSTAENPLNICYNSAGTYNVQLVVSDGLASDTIIKTITVLPLPSLNAGADVTIEPGQSVSLNATGTATSYLWTPATGLNFANIPNPVATLTVTTTYTVTGTDANGCQTQDEVTIFVETPCGEVFVPTAFSPNDDNRNEIVCVLGNCIVIMHFAIYDRWGEKVFETTEQEICWDGFYKGKLMNTQTFVYYLEGTHLSGEEIHRKGNISLIR